MVGKTVKQGVSFVERNHGATLRISDPAVRLPKQAFRSLGIGWPSQGKAGRILADLRHQVLTTFLLEPVGGPFVP
jgi:hypothetical protein